MRPPPKVLLIYDGADGMEAERHFQHMTRAGLDVSKARPDEAVGAAITFQPDIIILDFGCDGEIMAGLKSEPATARIPVIALADLGPANV